MPTSYVVQVRRRPPLPPPELRRPLTVTSVAPYRPLPQQQQNWRRAGSVPPPGHASRSPAVVFGIGSATVGWTPSTAQYAPRSSSLPPPSSAYGSYRGLRTTTTSRFADDDDLYDDLYDYDLISTTTRSNALRNRSSKYTSNAAQRAALKSKSSIYFDDIAEQEAATRKSLSDLRAKTLHVQSNIDQHKRLIDQCRPTSNGPSLNSFGLTSAAAAGGLSSYGGGRRYDSNYNSTPSFNSQTQTTTTDQSAARPPAMSEARRKLRKVLCESKGNQRYFD